MSKPFILFNPALDGPHLLVSSLFDILGGMAQSNQEREQRTGEVVEELEETLQ